MKVEGEPSEVSPQLSPFVSISHQELPLAESAPTPLSAPVPPPTAATPQSTYEALLLTPPEEEGEGGGPLEEEEDQ